MSRDVRTSEVAVLLSLLLRLWLGSCQDTVSIPQTTCVNGVLVYDNQNSSAICQCDPGWTGPQCSQCRGRFRLTNSSGVITDGVPDMNYSRFTQCLFYIEANESVSSIHLRVRLLHLECQWDYLHVFSGDSVFAPKLAAYTGNIIEESSLIDVTSNFTEFDPNTTTTSVQHTLSSSGSKMLLFFYSDAFLEVDGFEIAYWVDYECPEECSGQGQCNSTTGVCSCAPGWTGEACHIPACPNNCSSTGVCDMDLRVCVCEPGYLGDDCSVLNTSTHWSVVSYTASLPPSTLARAGHTSLVHQDAMLVYGGYRFPDQEYLYDTGDLTEGRGNGTDELLRYRFDSGEWEVLETSAAMYLEEEVLGGDGNMTTVVRVPRLPAPRYGHSAVLFDGCMYVFGGSLYPSEDITAELWRLNLTSLQWTPLFNHSTTMDNSSAPSLQPPVPVRGHTAHVVGSKMVVLFGLSSQGSEFPNYVQEYDFDTGLWSLVEQHGVTVSGRMGHSSVYSEETGVIYVQGGRGGRGFVQGFYSYDPVCGMWSSLSNPGALTRYLHSSVLLGPLLLSFAGCQGHGDSQDCFSQDLLLYNTLCDAWFVVELPGLPANASRYAHTAVLDPRTSEGAMVVFGGFIGTTRGDMVRLEMGECESYVTEADCVNRSVLCVWMTEEERCESVLVLEQLPGSNVSFACPLANCTTLDMASCTSTDGCQWHDSLSRCFPDDVHVPGTSCPAPSNSSALCVSLTTCESCQLHDCVWASSNGSRPACFSEEEFTNSPVNITEVESCPESSCRALTSCERCAPTSSCLWCPSLSICVDTYPTAFTFGQCLGWVDGSCERVRCEEMSNCSSCQTMAQCGWCNDPSNTGLGQCRLGGFGGPQNDTVCLEGDGQGGQEEWQFYQCSGCQCNGHSVCVNETSVCEQCMNNTAGGHCESCALGYFGQAGNGGSCAACECNGYDLECDIETGACTCQALGVTGDNCTACTTSGDYVNGDADNFCFADLAVGFIYTFTITASNEVQGFYAVTPPHDESLRFKFEMSSNPSDIPVSIQLFVGRRSENLWVLVNLTEPLIINTQGSFERRFDSFSSSENRSDSAITSFAHLAIRELDNFTMIYDGAVEDDYTSRMWDGDVTLVLRVWNLNNPASFHITVSQENFIYLLYFFATFITCFSVLLTVFLLVWFIKKKLAFRAYMRRQYIELQRRVARPFARVLLKVDSTPSSTTPLPTEQNPSYLGVEACRDDKGAVLSLLVQLPRDPASGRPSHGRTGLCLGSTLVYVNSSKKPKQQKKKSPPASSGDAPSSSSSSFLVHTGRARQRTHNDSVA